MPATMLPRKQRKSLPRSPHVESELKDLPKIYPEYISLCTSCVVWAKREKIPYADAACVQRCQNSLPVDRYRRGQWNWSKNVVPACAHSRCTQHGNSRHCTRDAFSGACVQPRVLSPGGTAPFSPYISTMLWVTNHGKNLWCWAFTRATMVF